MPDEHIDLKSLHKNHFVYRVRSLNPTATKIFTVALKIVFAVVLRTQSQPEVGKVTLKSNGDEALNNEFLLKSNGDEALNDGFL